MARSRRPPATVRSRIEAVVDLTGRATSWIALVIVVLMAVNVLLRYAFSWGSVWAQELEWHLLVPLIMFGMSYALLHGEHVRVDVLYARFSWRTQAIVDFVSALLSIAICAIFIWLTLSYVGQSWAIGEKSPDPGGLPFRFALKALLPLGFALMLAQSVAVLIASRDRLRSLGQ